MLENEFCTKVHFVPSANQVIVFPVVEPWHTYSMRYVPPETLAGNWIIFPGVAGIVVFKLHPGICVAPFNAPVTQVPLQWSLFTREPA